MLIRKQCEATRFEHVRRWGSAYEEERRAGETACHGLCIKLHSYLLLLHILDECTPFTELDVCLLIRLHTELLLTTRRQTEGNKSA